jgi:hypothetical protein
MKGPILGEHPCITIPLGPGGERSFVTNSEQDRMEQDSIPRTLRTRELQTYQLGLQVFRSAVDNTLGRTSHDYQHPSSQSATRKQSTQTSDPAGAGLETAGSARGACGKDKVTLRGGQESHQDSDHG